MLVGLPASGKSTKAKELSIKYNAIIHSSDALRKELYGDENSQDNNNDIFQIIHKRIKEDLKNCKSVIYDATNIDYKRRLALLSEFRNIECDKICVIMSTPYEICIEQNKQRDRQVPEYVIKKMYVNFHIPYWYEGWDDIQICYNHRKYIFPTEFIYTYKNYKQDNKHHEYTLGKHCLTCAEMTRPETNDQDIYNAALIHDCGKPFVKNFKNSKGEITEEAHYYQHHCVGSYDSLFYMIDGDKLKIATLILWHMQPYFWEKDKLHGNKHMNKYKKLWGDELFNDIMILHNADKIAH
jgi:predicted kinase